jgi:hypothetical protein
MATAPDSKLNKLLAALPEVDFERWSPHLEYIEMPLGEVVYEPGDVLSHVYFPTNAIVSLLYVMENGASAEIAVAGNEGLVGISLFMGGESTPSRAVVQSAGHGFRLPRRGNRKRHRICRVTQIAKMITLIYRQFLINCGRENPSSCQS